MKYKYPIIITIFILMTVSILSYKQQILSYLIIKTNLYDLVFVKNETLSFEIKPGIEPQTYTYEKDETSINFSWKNIGDKTIINISTKPHYNLRNGYFILPLEIKDHIVRSSINNRSFKMFDPNKNKELIIQPSLSMWSDSDNVEFEIDHTLFEQYNNFSLDEKAVNIQVEPFLVYQYNI